VIDEFLSGESAPAPRGRVTKAAAGAKAADVCVVTVERRAGVDLAQPERYVIHMSERVSFEEFLMEKDNVDVFVTSEGA
jgi:hypothetical protein